MDVSGEVADLMVKESLQAGETAVKLAATGLKNVAALILALSQSDYKIIGKASARKLAKDPAPAVVATLKTEDVERFQRLAKKEYDILFMIAKPNGKDGPTVDVISNERYAAKINALFQSMGYPIPIKKEPEQEEQGKKPRPALNKGDPRPSAGMARKRRRGHLNLLRRKKQSRPQQAKPLSGAVWPPCRPLPRAWRRLRRYGTRNTHDEKEELVSLTLRTLFHRKPPVMNSGSCRNRPNGTTRLPCKMPGL